MPDSTGQIDEKPQAPRLRDALAARLGRLGRSRISLAVFLGLTAVAVVAEPFGTHGALGLFARLTYWSIVVGASIVAGSVFDEVSQWIDAGTASWRVPLRAAAMMALAYTPFIVLVSKVFVFFGAPLRAYAPLIFLYSGVVSLTVYSVIHVLRPHLRDPADPAPDPESQPPRLAQRLACPDVTIYRISASDHLTEVATDQGVERIRLRFADAVTEMDPVPGTCVHRSHWVVLTAVTGTVRRNGKVYVTLVNGEELPVSRTYRLALEAALPDLD
ncbi:MAG: LytTR family transcriptional regulator [Rhodobacteraceae bacterium]|nr:MAG: LytTR family transcriptional regulator [Paracoccaceae bacterium]